MVLSPALKARVQAAMRNAVVKLNACKSQELCSSCGDVWPVWMICDSSVIPALDVLCTNCLNSPDIREIMDKARACGGVCPLCFSNPLLASPVEYEVSKEPLRNARELIDIGESYEVELQAKHEREAGVLVVIPVVLPGRPGCAARPSPSIPPVDESLYRSKKGTLTEAWWRGENSIITRYATMDVSLLSPSAHPRKISPESLHDFLGAFYTAKLHADECDDEKGSPRSTVAEYFLHYVKMGLGVQRLQQEQMCAIAKTTLEHVSSNPRFEVFALWSGLIEPSTYSIFTSVLTLEIIKRVIRPPTVAPFTNYRFPYVLLSEVWQCLESLFSMNPIWNFVFIKKDRDYKHITPPWKEAARAALATALLKHSKVLKDVGDPKRPHVAMSLKVGSDEPVINIDVFLLEALRAWTQEFLKLRDEKRVFYKYWAAKFVRLFMAAKRFRLLAPFKGSTVCDPGKPPIFSLEETRRLWAYVRGVRGWALEQYPMCRLESQEFLDIDYERVLRDVLWHFPRNVWQVRYLWTKEYTAWLKTERQRMNWTSWQWNMDWEWGGLRVDLTTPDVLEPASLRLHSDSELVKRVQNTLSLQRRRRRRSQLQVMTSPSRDAGSFSESEPDSSDIDDNGSPHKTDGSAAGLPLRFRPPSSLHRHVLETSALELQSMDAVSLSSPTKRQGFSSPILRRSHTSQSLTPSDSRTMSTGRPLSAAGESARSTGDLGFWSNSPLSRARDMTVHSGALPSLSPVSRARSVTALSVEAKPSSLALESPMKVASSRHLRSEPIKPSYGPVYAGGRVGEEYHMSALTGSPGKPQWATVARLSKAVDSQSRVNVARVASDGSESASPLNFGSSSPTASSRLPAVTSIPRHVVLSHNRGASPKAIGDMLASVADTESRRIRAVEETVVRTSAVASVAEGSASVLARLQLNAALLESPDEEQDDAAAADRKRVLLEQFSTDALTSSVARLRVTDPSERMAYIQPVQQLVFKEAGMTKEGCAVLVQSWALHGPLLSSILSIDLSSNKIGPEGAALLGTGIATASFALKELSVEDNSILDRGAAGLLEGLRMSPSLSTLTSLDLGKNGLKNGKLLAEFLSAAKSLQHFDAAWNQYNPEAGAYIAQSLIGNTALLSLSLQFNSFDDATGAAFMRVCTCGSESTTRRPASSPGVKRPPQDKKRAASPSRDKKKGPIVRRTPALHPSKIAPVGTSGGNCSVRRLDLSYNKLGAETGHSMNQALRSWIRKIPSSALTDASLRAVVTAAHAMCTPSEVLARATNTVDLDPPSYGVLKGLSKVCVAGTQIPPQDFTAASVIAKSAADEMDAGLDKACAVLLDELARETTGVEKDRVSTDLARQLQTDKERADKILVVYVSSGVFVGGLKKIG